MARQTSSERDLSLLSAYLDGELSDSERAQLEARLDADAALQTELEALRQTVALVQSLPQLRPPRNFTLDPAEYARRRPRGRWLRLAAPMIATGATLLVVSVCAAVLVIGRVGLSGSAAPVAREVAGLEVAEEEAAPAEEAAAPEEEEAGAPASEMVEEETAEEGEVAAPEVTEAEEAPAGAAAAEPAAEADTAEQPLAPAGTPTPSALAMPTLPAELAAPPAGEFESRDLGGTGVGGGAGEDQQGQAADQAFAEESAPLEEPGSDLNATATQIANQAEAATATLSAGVLEVTQVAEGAVPGDEETAPPQPSTPPEAVRAPRPYLLIGLGIGLTAVLGVLLVSAGVGIVVANRSR